MLNESKLRLILGEAIKELRTRNKLSQESLSERIGIAHNSLTKIETGRTFTTAKVLANLCNVFNVEPYVLFSKKVRYNSEEEVQYIEEINRLLPGFNAEKLEEIYNIILALKK